ncbi:MAG: carboxypeptidase-like regulatory domain-containing protein [Vicinamibacterales bacterium]
MRTSTWRVVLSALAALLLSTAAFAQGSATSSITGVVLDVSGGAIPGADVAVRNAGTGATSTAVTSNQGSFTIPALNTGTYTVTVSLMGFKTRVLNNVVLTAGSPANVRAVLEVGGIDETVTVSAGAEIIETSSSTVSTTLNVNQVSNLPLVSRNAIDFITFLPGVSTPGGNRDSTVNGLPQSVINITVDGMNVQDNHLKTTDGFFARMSPRLDAVEEVTVTMAAQGADAAGHGAVQIRFVTRSGSNDFSGSLYHYFRHHSLNANTWFNNRDGLDKPELVQNQIGGRTGGPIVIPGLWDGRDKAFFFINYEEFRQPTDVRRNRTILHPLAQQGIFRYNTTGGVVREVNLLALAASRGHTQTLDPTIAKLLADMRATTSDGTVTDLDDPNLQRFSFLTPQRSHNRYPTGRLDLNLSNAHRLSGSFNYQHINSNPDTLNNRDPRFPGFPSTGTQDSHRYTTKVSLRSAIGDSLVNEFSMGATGGPTYFSNELNPGMWGGTSIGDQGGFHLDIDTAKIDNASNGPTVQWREASTKVVENTVNWIKGSHSLSFGGSWTQVDLALFNQTLVPELDFDIISGDPAASLFTTANFPGASNTALADAGDLYAVLTGRVSGISGDARIDEKTGEFVFLGPSIQRGRMRETDFFVQDAWRVRPNLTINAGMRYVLQFPFYPLNNSYSTATLDDLCGVSGTNPDTVCNLFQPGNMPGKLPEFINFGEGTHAHETDWNNWAPSIGVAWTPTAGGGWRRLIGNDGDTVVRAGFAVAYSRNGTSQFTGVYGSNPGVAISANRNLSLDNLGAPPILFRNRDLLGPPEIPRALAYPFRDDVTGDLEMFDPNLQVPYARTWTAGIQRAISRNMAVEARYVGTQSGDSWQEMEFNEINIIENGFLDEFRAAQANLQANIAAGRGSTFQYFGEGTGTSPLPIFLAYIRGAGDPNNPALYTSSLFRNSDFVNPLALFNPNPIGAAAELFDSGSRRANALRAGLPANFFVVNPHQLGGAELTTNEGRSRHHSLQLELRRRLVNGFQFQSSYVLGRTWQSNFFSFRKPRLFRRDTGSEGETSHAFKANIVYELPFGRGRRFGSNVGGLVDRLIGGWSIASTVRIQSGRLVNLGNTRLVGMTPEEAGDLFRLRFDSSGRVFMLPQDVIDETVKAFSVSATSPTGYGTQGPPSGRYFAPANGPNCIELAGGFGDCGVGELIVTGPMFQNYDISVTKRVPIVGRVNAEFRVELLNAFNNVNFIPVGGLGNDRDDYEVTGLTGTPTSRIAQIVSRITW